MIFYVSRRRNAYPIVEYLQSRGRDSAERVQPVAWEDLRAASYAQPGTWIFSDLERLNPGAAQVGARVWRDLEAGGAPVRLLNHPTRAMRRYELLRSLRECGVNDFDVYRVTEARDPARYPVFVRRENNHSGSLTPLLHSKPELDRALEELVQTGVSRERLLITEFCDTSDDQNVYHKYSAFYVAGRVIPRHLFFGKDWVLKGPDLVDEEKASLERRYLETNPHEAFVREVFERARIGYGRIDYSLCGDRPQVWEINTNPWITSDGDYGGPLRASVGPRFAADLGEAWAQIDTPSDPERQIRLHPPRTQGRLGALWMRGKRRLRRTLTAR